MNQRTVLASCLAGSIGFAALGLIGLSAGCNADGQRNNTPYADMNGTQSRSGATASAGQKSYRPTPQDDFERTGGKVPVNADTLYAAGQLAEAREATAQAIEQYKKALELQPNHTDSLFRLGVIYTRQRHFVDAISAWDRFVKATGGDATGYANLGFCLEMAGRTGDAEAAYLKGVRRDPANAPCRVNYGLMLARHGRFSEATLEMQTVLSEAEVHYNLASVYEVIGRREQAKVEYRKALQIDPQMKEAQVRLDVLE